MHACKTYPFFICLLTFESDDVLSHMHQMVQQTEYGHPNEAGPAVSLW